MATADQFQLDFRYNFTVYAPEVLGNNFKGLKMIGLLDASTATALGTDVAALHANIYPAIPEPRPNNNYKSYNYGRFETASNDTLILGLPWIAAESVEQIGAQTRVIRIANTTSDDELLIQQALSANGFTVLDITTE